MTTAAQLQPRKRPARRAVGHPRREPPQRRLVLRLDDPELTATLRAGLGGLAASLRAIEALPKDAQPPGRWAVEKDRVILEWDAPEGSGPFFEALFGAAFRISAPLGLIDLPGAWGPLPVEVHVALQEALRRTFLQHGKTVRKAGPPHVRRFELDGRPHAVELQPYLSFVQQSAWREIAGTLDRPADRRKPLKLAAWAMPGAVERHAGLGATRWEYTPEQALCGCFALVGCVSHLSPGGGVLVVPDPTDLVAFARERRAMTPTELRGVETTGPADAALSARLALSRTAPPARTGVGRILAFAFRTTAWAGQQKSRVAQVELAPPPGEVLALYDAVTSALPGRVVDGTGNRTRPSTAFVVPSALRAMVADNLAAGRRWYAGFATAHDPFARDRWVHYLRTKENKGALRHEERGALQMMVSTLADAERVVVESVQNALRRRLGAIADEKRGSQAAMRRRWEYEREHWRLAFAGAKTLDQTRHALADMWSRAGSLTELHEGWPLVLEMLTPQRWQAARDLALIALASYQGRDERPAELEDRAA